MIGLLGTGRVGMPVCANLVRAGHVVIAHDLRQELQTQARVAGAQWAATAAEAAAAADVLITILPGPAEVREALVGAGGALRAMRRGTTWIDMSSNAAASAEPIRLLAVERGVDVLEAPVGGGVAAAEEGTLTFFVGGSAEVLDRHRAVFDALASRTASFMSADPDWAIPRSCWSISCGSARRSRPRRYSCWASGPGSISVCCAVRWPTAQLRAVSSAVISTPCSPGTT